MPEALVVREIRSFVDKITGDGKLSLNVDIVVVKTTERKGALPVLVRDTTKAAREDAAIAVRQIFLPVAGVQRAVLVCAVENVLYRIVLEVCSRVNKGRISSLKTL